MTMPETNPPGSVKVTDPSLKYVTGPRIPGIPGIGGNNADGDDQVVAHLSK
jgi:hypothetical protein